MAPARERQQPRSVLACCRRSRLILAPPVVPFPLPQLKAARAILGEARHLEVRFVLVAAREPGQLVSSAHLPFGVHAANTRRPAGGEL